PMWPLVIVGLIGLAAGVGTFMYPNITTVVLLVFIAAWAIVTGVFEIAAAIRLRQMVSGEWMLALAGVLSIVFGVLLLMKPQSGALAVVWIIACYAIVFGLVLVSLGFRLKGLVGPAPARA